MCKASLIFKSNLELVLKERYTSQSILWSSTRKDFKPSGIGSLYEK